MARSSLSLSSTKPRPTTLATNRRTPCSTSGLLRVISQAISIGEKGTGIDGAQRLENAVVDLQLPGVGVQVGRPDAVTVGQVALRQRHDK